MACLDDDANGQRPETHLQPVVFRDPQVVNADRVHLHLDHPLVQRLLTRFLMRGFQSDALEPRWPRRPRLHDELIAVVADWHPADPDRRLRKVSKEKGRQTLEDLEAESQQRLEAQEGVSACVQTHRVEPAGANGLRPQPADHL